MKYQYGTTDSYSINNGVTATVTEIASIIRKDVEAGKWNIYNGGMEESSTASCEYSRVGFEYHNRLYLYGTKEEFEQLESLIERFIEVIPRKFN